VGRHEGKNHLEDVGIYGRIVLKINLEEVLWEGMNRIFLA